MGPPRCGFPLVAEAAAEGVADRAVEAVSGHQVWAGARGAFRRVPSANMVASAAAIAPVSKAAGSPTAMEPWPVRSTAAATAGSSAATTAAPS